MDKSIEELENELNILKAKERNNKNLNIENALLFLSLPITNELLGYKFEIGDIYSIFRAISIILIYLESDWQEFLKVHHSKFELNYYERTNEGY